jgi:hypothetical protein
MSTTYQEVIDKAEIILQDEDSDSSTRRWTETELLSWATEGEREIVKLKPDANPTIESVLLSSGAQQALPSRAIQLLDVLSNMGTDGSTRGDIITVVERKLMDAVDPGWMIATAATTVTHVIYDVKRAPKIYWVYPKSPGTNYIEIMTGKLPDNSSAVIGDTLSLDDEYAVSLMHYILAMAFAKDSDIPDSAERSANHLSIFLQTLGRRDQMEEVIHPKRTRESD